jgi:hypothetical protein
VSTNDGASAGDGASTASDGASAGDGAAGAADRLLAVLACAASARARCSVCGRDTSRARIAALVVTFIAAIGPSSSPGPPLDNPAGAG